jgi:hypothetical protein
MAPNSRDLEGPSVSRTLVLSTVTQSGAQAFPRDTWSLARTVASLNQRKQAWVLKKSAVISEVLGWRIWERDSARAAVFKQWSVPGVLLADSRIGPVV